MRALRAAENKASFISEGPVSKREPALFIARLYLVRRKLIRVILIAALAATQRLAQLSAFTDDPANPRSASRTARRG